MLGSLVAAVWQPRQPERRRRDEGYVEVRLRKKSLYARDDPINVIERFALMKRREGYKGYVIVARSHELRDGGFSAEFSIEEHDPDGVMETEFHLPGTFQTQDAAIEAGIQAGRQKIDAGKSA